MVMMGFNYLTILKAYINHVGDCEGITFRGDISTLTASENEELERIQTEVQNEYLAICKQEREMDNGN
jgi:hypothetical protein